MRDLHTLGWIGVSIVIGSMGCGPQARSGGDDDDDDGGDDDPPPIDSGPVVTTDGSNTDGCSDAAKLVYVFDSENRLATFDPETKTFDELGVLDCPGVTGLPNSMGIDRTATAWVNYYGASSRLFKVDTKTLECSETGWMPENELNGRLGMAFSTNTANGTEDTLFIASDTLGAPKIASLDTSTMSSTMIGPLQGMAELTGTGNAELWGVFPSLSESRIQQLDKA